VLACILRSEISRASVIQTLSGRSRYKRLAVGLRRKTSRFAAVLVILAILTILGRRDGADEKSQSVNFKGASIAREFRRKRSGKARVYHDSPTHRLLHAGNHF
jgi:hypothetical protein